MSDLETLRAEAGAIYTIVDAHTGEPVDGLTLERKHDDLEIELDPETTVQIEGFYADDLAASFSLDGSFDPAAGLAVRSADLAPVSAGTQDGTLGEEPGSVDAGDSGFEWANPMTWGWQGALVGGVVAAGGIGGGIAAAAGGGGGGSSPAPDTTPPEAPELALDDTGSSGGDGLTNDTTVDLTGLEEGATWEYSLDGGETWEEGTGTSFELADDAEYAIGDVQVRQTDGSGNSSEAVSNDAPITTDTTAPSAPSLLLADDTGSSAIDGLTNDATVDVTGIEEGASWEYSVNGGDTWSDGTGTSFELADDTGYAIDDVQVRQTDAAGNTGEAASNAAAITTDMTVPATPSLALATDTGSSDGDGITSDATVNVTGIEEAASWEYSVDGGETWSDGTGTSFELADDTAYAIGAVQVRQTDMAGNTSSAVSNAATITTDMTDPDAPGLGLADDTGSSDEDGIATDATVAVTGVEAAASWEYSVDGGDSWADGEGTSFELASDTTYEIGDVQVRQTDAAGHTSAVASNETALTIDNAAPSSPAFALATDSGSSSSDGTTNNPTANMSGLEVGASWEYSLDGGETWTAGSGATFDLADNTSYAVGDVRARQMDVAGNTGIATGNAGPIVTDSVAPAAPSLALSKDTGSSAEDGLTNDAKVVVTGIEEGASWEYSIDGGAWVNGEGTSFELADDTVYAIGDLQVRQTDVAGNLGSAGSNEAELTTDMTAPDAPSFALAEDTGSSAEDGLTNDATVNVTGVEAGASWEYSVDGGESWVSGEGTSFELASNTAYGIGAVQVRQTDAAGNTSEAASNAAGITTDMTAPDAPGFALATDTGSSNTDGITMDATVDVTGVEEGASWEYSVDGGESWVSGEGTSFELASNTAYGIGAVQVRQTDAAGNTSEAASNAAGITTDMTAPDAPGFALATDTGSSNTDGITMDATVDVTGVEEGASWEYSVDGGESWVAGADTSFELADDTVYAIGDVQVRQTDAAGNTSEAASNEAAITTDMTAPTLSSSTPTDEATGVALGANVVLSFDESIALGSAGDVVVSDGSDTQTIDVTAPADQLSIDTDKLTVDPTNDLANGSSNYNVQIDAGAITDLAGNSFAGITDSETLDFTTESGVDTSIVVFDLIGGQSSDHSSQTFAPDVEYTIYVRVDSNSQTISLDLGEEWGSAGNLGSNDLIVLVGDGTPVIGNFGSSVSGFNTFFDTMYWTTPTFGALFISDNGTAFRSASLGFSSLDLWTGTWASNPNASATLSDVYVGATGSYTMPDGILTSQGLLLG